MTVETLNIIGFDWNNRNKEAIPKRTMLGIAQGVRESFKGVSSH